MPAGSGGMGGHGGRQQSVAKKEQTASTSGKNTNTGDLWNSLKSQGLTAGWEDGNVSSLSPEQVNAALATHGNYDVQDAGAWRQLQALQAQKIANDNADRLAEYQAGMMEMFAQMAEAQSYVAPYQQPVSQAAADATTAREDTRNRQLLRRGLLSLTRFGNSTGGKSSSLGVA